MTVKPDGWIERMVRRQGMIEPFVADQVRDGAISYGVSSYGYDLRLATEFRVFAPGANRPAGAVIDPKHFDAGAFDAIEAEVCIVPANSFVLARSVEYFRIPRNVVTLCTGKSTYARCGVLVNVTPFEPEWEGHVTMAISNTAPVPVKLYANEGVAQVLFFVSDEDCRISYADKKGKYQAQRGITPPRVP